jgi:hypothetical protein
MNTMDAAVGAMIKRTVQQPNNNSSNNNDNNNKTLTVQRLGVHLDHLKIARLMRSQKVYTE